MSDTEHSDMLDDETTVVRIAGTMVEAQLAEAALRQAGIPCIVQDFSLNPYDGLWVSQKGWGQILVPAGETDRAKEIIHEALAPGTPSTHPFEV